MSEPFLNYSLPSHLIAQQPCTRRDLSRLMLLNRHEQSISHHQFGDLPDILQPDDLLVPNDTRVLQARLLGRRVNTGGKWEGLFLRDNGDGTWEMMCQTRGHLQPGETIAVDPPPLKLTLVDKYPDGHWRVAPSEPGTPSTILSHFGHVPLPPYIRKGRAETGDRERYQTVYAAREGAVAAPTAGLHFTPDVIMKLEERGIQRAFVTLHVGLGTFQPLQYDEYKRHEMHAEWGDVPQDTVAAIRSCRERCGRVVAVGTTTVRLLESVAATGNIHAWSGETRLYIHPPYTFRAVDALVTNFHLPKTTLLLLVGAFAGSGLLREAYRIAVEKEYRFFSYGDAMLIV